MAEKDYGKFKVVETNEHHEENKDERKKRIVRRRKARKVERRLQYKIAA